MQLHIIEFCNVIKRAESEFCVLHPHHESLVRMSLLRSCLMRQLSTKVDIS